jgi:hypothetical protein
MNHIVSRQYYVAVDLLPLHLRVSSHRLSTFATVGLEPDDDDVARTGGDGDMRRRSR